MVTALFESTLHVLYPNLTLVINHVTS